MGEGQGLEAGDAKHRRVRGEGQGLRRRGANAEPREGARADGEHKAIQSPGGQRGFLEKFVKKGEKPFIMNAGARFMALQHLFPRGQGKRAGGPGGVEGENIRQRSLRSHHGVPL